MLICRSEPVSLRGRLFRAAVCLATGAPVNHVALAVDYATDGEPVVMSVETGGVVIRRAGHYRHAVWCCWPLTDHERRVVVATARLMSGRYGWGSVVRAALVQPHLLPITGRDRPCGSGRGVTCSQVVAAGYEAAGHRLVPWAARLATPADLWSAAGRPPIDTVSGRLVRCQYPHLHRYTPRSRRLGAENDEQRRSCRQASVMSWKRRLRGVGHLMRSPRTGRRGRQDPV